MNTADGHDNTNARVRQDNMTAIVWAKLYDTFS